MSSRYGHKERLIATALSKFPLLKKAGKAAYQRLQYLLHKKNYQFQTQYSLQEVNYQNKETFFGYYDHSPLNEAGNYLIFQAAGISTRLKPDPETPVEVVLYDWKKGKVKKVFSSSAYNWQQGTKLQWLDRDRFIFNDYDQAGDRYVSRIVDTKKGQVTQTIAAAVYDCHKDFALGLNFDRLMLLRPDYGYFNRKSSISLSKLDDRKDGIFYIDLEKDNQELLISLQELKNFKSRPGFDKSLHKVNHIMISPGGSRCIFLHRWLHKGMKTDRLILFDLQLKDLILLAEGMVSHFAWMNNDQLFGYMAPKGKRQHITPLSCHSKILYWLRHPCWMAWATAIPMCLGGMP
ncbi:MAG: hypothetical protein U5Q03_16670 [Bacteroidota bacterium]|nr:hypothetical protein [Bacteroidota bacterium]